jgi:DNA-binding protein
MSYVLACVTQFNEGQTEVILRARGRQICHAVDIAEIVRNKFMIDTEVRDVKIGTDQIMAEDGQKLNVSTVTITLAKKARTF